jgi:hypothetical protein
MSAEREAVLAALLDERVIAVRPTLVRLLGARDAIILQQVRWHCDHEGHADVTAPEIAAETGLTKEQARRGLAILVDAGILAWEEPERFSRKRWYRLVDAAQEPRPDVAELPSLDVAVSPRLPIEKKRTTKTRVSFDSVSFDAFWSVYPLKTDKGHARLAYGKACTRATAQEIQEGLERTLPFLRASGKYCPHAATWLNGDRWLDEAPVAQKPKHWSEELAERWA